MIQLRCTVDFDKNYDNLKQLPVKLQEEIRQCLDVFDKHYGEQSKRLLEGGMVICLEKQDEVERTHDKYNLAMNVYINTFQEEERGYLMAFIMDGRGNNILVVGQEQWLKPYLYV